MFAANLAFVLVALGALAACGWSAVAPFRSQVAYPLAQAPLAGMILATLGTAGVSVVLGVSIRWAAVATLVGLSVGSLVSVRLDGRRQAGGAWLAVTAVVLAAAAAVWFLTRTDLFFGAPGLVYAHGTDHLGYAHVADWVRLRPGNVRLNLDPTDWYGSWPHLIYTRDPRFGSFVFLDLVSIFSGRSGAFSYDLASAVLLSAGSIGVAASFARRPVTFALLATGLFTSFWFDWNRGGYLGKTMAYPATILVASLLFTWIERARQLGTGSLAPLAALAALTAGTAIMLSGIATALTLALIGVTLLVLTAIVASKRGFSVHTLHDPAMGLALTVGLSILASGNLARPVFYERIEYPWTWPEVLVRVLELEGLVPGRTALPPRLMWVAAVLLLAAWGGLAVLAVAQRSISAATLLIAPLVLLGGLVVADRRWEATNFVGIYAPLVMCALAILVDSLRGRAPLWLSASLLALFTVGVALHLPRFAAAASFHGGANTPPLFRFSSREIEALGAAIVNGGGTALVDIGGAPQFPIFLMVELGRLGVPLQWTERSWSLILAYRRWPVPAYPTPAPLRIVMRGAKSGGSDSVLVLQTTQFDLLRDP